MRHLVGLLLLLVVLAWTTTAHATVILSGEFAAAETDNSAAAGYATASAYTSQIVADDLIDVHSDSLDPATLEPASFRDKDPFFESSTLNDGTGHPTNASAGTYWPVAFGSSGKLPATYTFDLDLSDSPTGYDIQEIRSYAGWNQNGSTLANQKYELQVSTVGNTEFASLGVFTYTPFADDDTREAAATKVTLTEDTTGIIASGVDAVRFILMDTGIDNAIGTTNIDGIVYHEIDVIGFATVPEPATVWMLVAGGLAALVLLRRRAFSSNLD